MGRKNSRRYRNAGCSILLLGCVFNGKRIECSGIMHNNPMPIGAFGDKVWLRIIDLQVTTNQLCGEEKRVDEPLYTTAIKAKVPRPSMITVTFELKVIFSFFKNEPPIS